MTIKTHTEKVREYADQICHISMNDSIVADALRVMADKIDALQTEIDALRKKSKTKEG